MQDFNYLLQKTKQEYQDATNCDFIVAFLVILSYTCH